MIRVFFSATLALLLTWSLFLALSASIQMSGHKQSTSASAYSLSFVRVKKNSETIRKTRIKPKKPKPPPTPPKALSPKLTKLKAPKISPVSATPLRISPPINLAASNILGDAIVSSQSKGAISTGLIPLVRVNPIYPRRAKKLKKEGIVKLEFTITPKGAVRDVSVISSHPKKLFDKSAIRALSKWKFRAKVVDGKPVEQRASVQINFRLDK